MAVEKKGFSECVRRFARILVRPHHVEHTPAAQPSSDPCADRPPESSPIPTHMALPAVNIAPGEMEQEARKRMIKNATNWNTDQLMSITDSQQFPPSA